MSFRGHIRRTINKHEILLWVSQLELTVTKASRIRRTVVRVRSETYGRDSKSGTIDACLSCRSRSHVGRLPSRVWETEREWREEEEGGGGEETLVDTARSATSRVVVTGGTY